MYAPEDKDPPKGKELPNLFELYYLYIYIYRRLYHRHRDQLLAVTLT